MVKLETCTVTRTLKRPFAISTGVRTHQDLVCVSVTADGLQGRGEAAGVSYLGETAASMLAQIEAVRGDVEAGAGREALLTLMGPGGARAALDAALWDIEARRAGRSVASLCGLPEPEPLTTAFTIGLDSPGAMEAAARDVASHPLLKVKLGGSDGLDGERAKAVRRGAPDARLVADANCGWTPETLPGFAAALAEQGFALLEQPLPAGEDEALDGFRSPLPLCGDESCQSMADLDAAAARYDVINIKLDKCGGLTHALEMRARLRELGKGIFVGCMISSARTVAPALVLAQDADYADLDAPVWLADDEIAVEFDAQGRIGPFPRGFWGDGA